MPVVKYRQPDAPYHIAILGRSGVGKSSLCNTLRRLTSEQSDAAPVGVIETTATPTCYPLMENVFLWDVPGVSTPNVSKDDYCHLIDINRYDMFLILSRSRFTEIDLWLSDIVRDRFEKTLFFIRTGIDEELRNHRRDYPNQFNASQVLVEIRENSLKNLQMNLSKSDLSLYLINTKDQTKYDFPQFLTDMMKYVHHERDHCIITVIKDEYQDDEHAIKQSPTALQTAATIVTQWARLGLVPYLYDRYRQSK